MQSPQTFSQPANSSFQSQRSAVRKPLMEEKTRGYLNGCGDNPERRIEFDWEGERYSTVSDLLIVRHS